MIIGGEKVKKIGKNKYKRCSWYDKNKKSIWLGLTLIVALCNYILLDLILRG